MRFTKAFDKWMCWPLVIALGVGGAVMSWFEYRAFLVEEIGVDVEVVERYYDRELRLLEAAERAGPYAKWAVGIADENEFLQDSRSIIRNRYAPELGDEGARLLELLALKLGEPGNPTAGYGEDETYRANLRSWLLAGNGTAWDYELFCMATRDPAVKAVYFEQNDRLLARAVAITAVFAGSFFKACAPRPETCKRASFRPSCFPSSTFNTTSGACSRLQPWGLARHI